MAGKKKVAIVMGSKSDLSVMEEASKILDSFDIPYDVMITSAHRSPERTRLFAQNAKKNGVGIIIAGAGGAAHLAGVIAADTTLPVIGVPVAATPLGGLDSLLSTAQMPGGVSVATMAIGKPGAKNAGVMAAQILALSDEDISKKFDEYKIKMAEAVGK